MNKWYILLGVACMLVTSGCGSHIKQEAGSSDLAAANGSDAKAGSLHVSSTNNSGPKPADQSAQQDTDPTMSSNGGQPGSSASAAGSSSLLSGGTESAAAGTSAAQASVSTNATLQGGAQSSSNANPTVQGEAQTFDANASSQGAPQRSTSANTSEQGDTLQSSADTSASGGSQTASSTSSSMLGSVEPSSNADSANQPSASGGGTAEPSSQQAPSPATTAISISITGDDKLGSILQETSVPVQEGMTVLDALKQVTKANKIQMEYQGRGTFAYVQGIDNLYEFDRGPKSGWVYKVNGKAPGEGAGSYKAAPGDKIEWLYTLDLGEDVGAKMP
ncbi:DUF4430 domain-containing protein [Paenibacillus hexagrammi]|uniref:DUF4430 domain-containing protein n=1 Tax=Paenibacillus hexagrammi TaxID=2908839 RepID=A0ABY3SFR9_9BACL|nr:DUF4430 domain-containing protein [Paenibacillus sp. YPD9-1]UJF32614.1 DUF4430 domain-containing protein [Paenibacillus sp. YPD9-1]